MRVDSLFDSGSTTIDPSRQGENLMTIDDIISSPLGRWCVHNAWSDEARAASIAARRSSTRTGDKAADKATSSANRASSNAVQANGFLDKGALHQAAGEAHEKAAIEHDRINSGQTRVHEEAAEAHFTAAKNYAKHSKV